MKVTAIKTDRIRPKTLSILEVLDKFLPEVTDRSIIAITSKVVSICENRLVPFKDTSLSELIKRESDYYLPFETAAHKLTITRNILIPKAGIDKSDFSQSYILWPKDPQKTANEIREFIRKKSGHKNIGVILTDSTTAPLMRGVRGISIAHSGFLATKKNKTDVRASVVEGLAAAAVVVMGEGAEQTPIAVISDIPFVDFVDNDPSVDELSLLNLDFTHDIYGKMLSGLDWLKGDGQARGESQ